MKDEKSKVKETQSRRGGLPPRYTFFLNPYMQYRFTSCPLCEQSTKLRNFALLIHIKPLTLMALNMPSRFCPNCELLIVHQDQLEEQLAAHDPSAFSNGYWVFGTLERKAWREVLRQPKPASEMLKDGADFKEVVSFQIQPAGWYPKE
jgi:hypothetical protein